MYMLNVCVYRMRLACDVELMDRSLAGLNVRKSSKPIRGQLSVGKQDGSAHLMLCTSKDKTGTKFKVELEEAAGNCF